jgi:hypothetical protein
LWYRRRKVGRFACVIHTSYPLRLHNTDGWLNTPPHHHTTTRITSPFCLISPPAAILYQSQRRSPYTFIIQQKFTMAIGIFTILAGLVAVTAAYFYFFGISPETKRKMEQQALKTMGENKMSYMAKGKLPISFNACHSPAQALLTSEHSLTPPRPDQQDSHLGPRRHQEPQAGHQQPRRRRHAEPSRRTSW